MTLKLLWSIVGHNKYCYERSSRTLLPRTTVIVDQLGKGIRRSVVEPNKMIA